MFIMNEYIVVSRYHLPMCDNLFVDIDDVISVQAESAARTESLQLCAAAGCQAIYTLLITVTMQ